MHGLLRSIIREVIEELEERDLDEDDLDEFSGVAALGGGPAMPLGVGARYPDSRVDEANTVSVAGTGAVSYLDLNNDGVRDDVTGKLQRSHDQAYYDSVAVLAKAFGGAENPFPSIRHARKHIARKY